MANFGPLTLPFTKWGSEPSHPPVLPTWVCGRAGLGSMGLRDLQATEVLRARAACSGLPGWSWTRRAGNRATDREKITDLRCKAISNLAFTRTCWAGSSERRSARRDSRRRHSAPCRPGPPRANAAAQVLHLGAHRPGRSVLSHRLWPGQGDAICWVELGQVNGLRWIGGGRQESSGFLSSFDLENSRIKPSTVSLWGPQPASFHPLRVDTAVQPCR